VGTIVVGTDGSEHARAALRWAVDEARFHEAAVRAVHAWTIVPVTAPPFGEPPVIHPTPDEIAMLQEAAQRLLDESVDEVAAAKDGPAIERKLVQGLAAEALLAEAQDADLLVVGSRGLGGFKGLLLGSVGQQVAHHAPCPVVIVRRRES
jgi:nucleotide-binding universal stress UspA family protein